MCGDWFLRNLLLWFLLVIWQPLAAQFPQLYFQNISASNGLSNDAVTCVYQDREGFLWIGTRFGLNRYDGTVFTTFFHDPDNPNSLSGNHIVDILEDQQGIFWIATKDGGLTRYDPSQPGNNQFKQFSHDPTLSSSIATNRLNCLLNYDSDYLLIGAEVIPGIFLNKKTLTFSYVEFEAFKAFRFSPPGASSSKDVHQMWIHKAYKDEDGYLISFLSPAWVVRITLQGPSARRFELFFPEDSTVPERLAARLA